MNMINVLLNGEDLSIEDNITISDLIDNLDLDVTKVAVEKNLEIISPESFKLEKIAQGDKIEIVHFIGGG